MAGPERYDTAGQKSIPRRAPLRNPEGRDDGPIAPLFRWKSEAAGR
jgi:hypothetical protein